jgi:hypothetical protein
MFEHQPPTPAPVVMYVYVSTWEPSALLGLIPHSLVRVATEDDLRKLGWEPKAGEL